MEPIGPYLVQDVIAKGGAGVVYRAHDPRVRRDVAIKVLLAGGQANQGQLERFRREGEVLAQLHHPNVVGVHDLGYHRGSPYLVMDLVEGQSLWARMREQGCLPGQEVARLGAALADALEHAHHHGTLHRDVKPHNVLLTPAGEPRLTDFGLARLLDSTSHGPTRTGTLMGTPGFLPPEQAFGGTPGPPADVYGLGATLYALLTGVPPHACDDLKTFLARLASEEPAPPSTLAPDLEPELEAVVLKCLHKDPAARYATAAALGSDLRAFLSGEPTTAGQEGAARQRRRTRRRLALALVGLGCCAAFAWASGRVTAKPQTAAAPRSLPSAAGESPSDHGAPAGPAPDPTGPQDAELLRLNARFGPDYSQDSGALATAAKLDPALKAQAAQLATADGLDVGAVLDTVEAAAANEDAANLYQVERARKKATDAFEKGRIPKALGYLQTALELIPGHPGALADRGLAHWVGGDLTAAEQDLDRAVLRGRDDAAPRLSRALFHLGQRRFAPALEDLDRAVELDPSYATHLQRARARLAREAFADALADLDAANAIVGHDRDPLTHALRAWALVGLGRADDALATCEAGVSTPRTAAWLLTVRARLHRDAGHRQLAVDDLLAAGAGIQPAIKAPGDFPLRLVRQELFLALQAEVARALAEAAGADADRLRALQAQLDRVRANADAFRPHMAQ